MQIYSGTAALLNDILKKCLLLCCSHSKINTVRSVYSGKLFLKQKRELTTRCTLRGKVSLFKNRFHINFRVRILHRSDPLSAFVCPLLQRRKQVINRRYMKEFRITWGNWTQLAHHLPLLPRSISRTRLTVPRSAYLSHLFVSILWNWLTVFICTISTLIFLYHRLDILNSISFRQCPGSFPFSHVEYHEICNVDFA